MGWFHPLPVPATHTPQHRELPPDAAAVRCRGSAGMEAAGTALAEGVKPPAVRGEPSAILLQPGRGFQSYGPKYVYNFLFQKRIIFI